ncbi:MAG: phosphoribosyltransferase family protein, partial [Myxococcota bacterium]
LLEPLAHGPACFEYGGPLADALRRLKYGKRIELVRPLAQLLLVRADEHRGEVDMVVPVPPSAARRRDVGFDWMAMLAEPLASELGVPLVRDALMRREGRRRQAVLGRNARLVNMDGAFDVRPVKGRVLVVDDVRTTGATLRAAKEVLEQAGASRVRVLALAAS